jgi:hypothetical protein
MSLKDHREVKRRKYRYSWQYFRTKERSRLFFIPLCNREKIEKKKTYLELRHIFKAIRKNCRAQKQSTLFF